MKPQVVSFHFGLPEAALLRRVKAAGCVVLSSATTVKEARWLEARGVDAVIAQGCEAGGHRGIFLSDDLAGQVGTFALIPQIADAVKVPVIAAGAVSDARGIAAAFVLGASGVQIGSAYLHCPESKISAPHRAALESAGDDGTAVTNLMTGRPARGIVNRVMREIGPISAGRAGVSAGRGRARPAARQGRGGRARAISRRCGRDRPRRSVGSCRRGNSPRRWPPRLRRCCAACRAERWSRSASFEARAAVAGDFTPLLYAG